MSRESPHLHIMQLFCWQYFTSYLHLFTNDDVYCLLSAYTWDKIFVKCIECGIFCQFYSWISNLFNGLLFYRILWMPFSSILFLWIYLWMLLMLSTIQHIMLVHSCNLICKLSFDENVHVTSDMYLLDHIFKVHSRQSCGITYSVTKE